MRYFSVFQNDQDILVAFDDIFLKKQWYDADITYSTGKIWDGIRQPIHKSDLKPVTDDTIQDDARVLKSLEDKSCSSIVFDPPFLFRKRNSDNNDKISNRFSCFGSIEQLHSMYIDSLSAIFKKLKPGGFLFFKTQDMTDGKFFCNHVFVIQEAEKAGFVLKDIAIKSSGRKLQRDAKQQNCLAKTHTYWLVFQKKREQRKILRR